MTDIVLVSNRNKERTLGDIDRYCFTYELGSEGLILTVKEKGLILTAKKKLSCTITAIGNDDATIVFNDDQETMIGTLTYPGDFRILHMGTGVALSNNILEYRLPLTNNIYTIVEGPPNEQA